MRNLPYDIKLSEAQKPIYKDSAKSIWDKTYELYGDDFDVIDIVSIARDIINCIEMESRYNISDSIFDVIPITQFDKKASFVKKHIELLREAPKHKYDAIDFLYTNTFTICQSDKLNELLKFVKSISDVIGKDLMLLVDGGYFDQGEVHYLSNYARRKCWKSLVKETLNNRFIWKIKTDTSDDSETDDDIILDDMAFVWNPSFGYVRFLDVKQRWGFINVVNGKRYYMPEYVHHIRDYHYGRAVYQDSRTRLYGYVDKEGKIMIEAKFHKAMDFVFHGEPIAVVDGYKDTDELTYDYECLTPWGEPVDMGITIFRNILTIRHDGSFTKDIQQKYEEELLRYKEQKRESHNARKNKRSNYIFDDEDDIWNALSNGQGDIFGF